MPQTLGTDLHPEDQKAVRRQYVYRYTMTYVPDWARQPRPDGTRYMPQFASDADWLAHTTFTTRSNGRLDRRSRFCHSSPTWPLGKDEHK